MIQKLNYFFTRLFDILLYPFSFIHEFWGFLFLSILMSFVVLYIYKWVSSPSSIVEAKSKIKANILAIRLYKDLWQIIVSSFFNSLYYTFKYFLLNFYPVLLIIPILFPSFAQMDARYGMKPFDTGDQFTVKVVFQHNPNELNVKLMESEFYKPKMNPLFINAKFLEWKKTGKEEISWEEAKKLFKDSTKKIETTTDADSMLIKESNLLPLFHSDLNALLSDETKSVKDLDPKKRNPQISVESKKYEMVREVNWKLEALKPGLTSIRIKVGDQIFEKQLRIGEVPSATAVSNSKMKESSWAHMIYPIEPLLPQEGDLAKISVHYPAKYITVLGIEWNWIVLNIVLILIVVLAFKNKFGIEF